MIIVDSNQLCYTSFYSRGHLKSTDDEGTGIIFGFLVSLFKIVQRFEDRKVIFAWDSKKNYRKMFYKNYKNKRDEQRKKAGITPEHLAQFQILRRVILPQIGFRNVFMIPGLESDDIIAKICHQFPLDKKIIVSSDSDLYQLLDIQTSMFNPTTKKMYTVDDWWKKYGMYGLTSSQFNKIKALAGCKTDKVKGIVGVGDKTAVKYFGGKLKKESKIYKKITRRIGQLIYERNLDLVTLPHPWYPIPDFKIRVNRLSYDAFYAICVDYEFRSIIKEMKEWKKVFKLK